ncbi:MAG: hypothetical protein K2H30_06065 [Clostridia bacterium]|nr:hypothetical protein [Clostridia bacterium]MDE7265798.1 hypothetical protein [Clostridia bacterium]
MDNLTQTENGTADTAQAEKENAAAVLGKFKDVQTLMKAYSDLQAEFTRRSQRLSELEKENKAKPTPDGEEVAPSQTDEEQLISAALSSERVKDAVIADYLKSVSSPKSVPLIAGGGGVAAPRISPKSVKEAGRLAQEFLKK